MKNLFSVIVSFLLLQSVAYSQIPANDECSGATVISALPYHATQNTRLATPNASDPVIFCAVGADSSAGKTVWYTWTADSTGYVTFTTINSTPATYDIAMAMYTGTCGHLTQIDCNDDIVPGTTRQAQISRLVQAGTTYTILIGEWNGGGPNGGVPTGGDLVFDIFWSSLQPLYAGPKYGLVSSGATTSTNGFSIASPVITPKITGNEEDEDKEGAENDQQIFLPAPKDVKPPLGPKGSNYHEMLGVKMTTTSLSQPVVLKSFQGNISTGYIPPDPILAVGPNYIVSIVNSSFRILDKNGTLYKNIDLNTWFTDVKSSPGFSDPQVIYDHYSHRWVMTGLATTTPYSILLSVSDDDNPLGTWTNWSLPATLGDSVTGNLNDQPQLGYDNKAIYITDREFASSFLYSRVRIIEKTQLYKISPDTVRWADFWDFREPDHRTVPLDKVRPSIEYGSPGVHFLIAASPYSPGTFFTIYTINDPIGTPTITGANVPVVQYDIAPNPSQLGGGLAIEGDLSSVSHKAVYRDSSLWVVHSIASGSGDAYSAVHYVRFNPWASANLEDVAMGATGYWHFYTALTVDGNDNVLVTYNRSGVSDYIGAFVSGHRAIDPPGLSTSVPVKTGLANYVQDFGSGRNRWGDYNGIALDPLDSSITWMNTEAASTGNNWLTWVGEIKMAPISGKILYAYNPTINFGTYEKGVIADTQSVIVTNFGTDTLSVSSISAPDSNFQIVNPPSFPIRLGTYDSASIRYRFTPKRAGQIQDTIQIHSDDSFNSSSSIALTGTGYVINAAQSGTMYGCTGSPSGSLLTVNYRNASTSTIGPSGYDQLARIRVRPSTQEIYGLAPVSVNMGIVRVNSTLGDAHPVSTIPLTIITAMAFRNDTMYVSRQGGTIYRVNISTGAATLVASCGIVVTGMDFNPLTGDLWVAGTPFSGGSRDAIYKVALPSGAKTLVGTTGFGVATNDIVFDGAGHLFGIIGNVPSNLIIIDTATASGTLVGSLGSIGIQGLGISPGTVFYTQRYVLTNDWNLLSLPVTLPSYGRSAIFGTSTSKAFYYEGTYVPSDTLAHGLGFWLKFNASAADNIPGSPILDDTIAVKNKWNIIGSIGIPIPIGQITTSPPGIITSNFFRYNGGYVVTDTIVPGNGYWVRVNADGQLVFQSTTALPKHVTISQDLSLLNRANSLTISNLQGNKQTLYFTRQPADSVTLSRFDLPPVPPEEAFDARFVSNRLVQIIPAKQQNTVEFPITVHSQSPVSLAWHIEPGDGLHYFVQAVNSKSSAVTSHALTGDGVWHLDGNPPSDLRLRIEQKLIPTAFALQQNYPNPFNPSTVIRYELPSDALVTLVVYDVLGKEVARLVNGKQAAGDYEVPFEANALASGVYFYRLTAGDFISVQKMVLMK